jgi:hypothetical protein
MALMIVRLFSITKPIPVTPCELRLRPLAAASAGVENSLHAEIFREMNPDAVKKVPLRQG